MEDIKGNGVGNDAGEEVSFKKSELMMYGALNYDGNEVMCAITGYGLQVSFNMRLINSLADAESCADALADVFYRMLMEQLIARKVDFFKQEPDEKAILKKERKDVDNPVSDEREEPTWDNRKPFR